jgi:hypothetical protein
LESKATLMRDQNSVSTAPSSPELKTESHCQDLEKTVPQAMASLDAVSVS